MAKVAPGDYRLPNSAPHLNGIAARLFDMEGAERPGALLSERPSQGRKDTGPTQSGGSTDISKTGSENVMFHRKQQPGTHSQRR